MKIHGVWMCLLCLSLPALAQRVGVPPAIGTGEQTTGQAAPDTTLTLNVAVTDRSGKLVRGLHQQDFAVFDNKKPQTMNSFREVESGGSEPMKVILMVDEVNTAYSVVAYEREQLKRFFIQNGGKMAQPITLAFFSDDGVQMQDAPSADGAALLALLDSHEAKLRSIRRSQGFYGATDRYQLSLETLESLANAEARTPGRKLVVWISPGWPMLSGPNVELTNREMDGLFRNVVDMSALLRRAEITLYAVDPLGMSDAGSTRQFYYKSFLNGVKNINDVQSGNLALQVLAVQSGGMVLNASNDITGEIARCVADADGYYVLQLSFAPAEKPDEYHSIVVQVNRPGLTARTRTGYYAQTPSNRVLLH